MPEHELFQKKAIKEAIKLDSLRTLYKLLSEDVCRHIFAGKIPFSDEYIKQLIIHRFWDLQVKRKKGRKVCLRYLRKVAKVAGTLEHIHASLEYGIEQRELAWHTLKGIKKRALQHGKPSLRN
jgi:hypothetical protein